MHDIHSIAILDKSDEILYVWWVSTGEVKARESRLCGAWNFEDVTYEDIDDLLTGRYVYLTNSAEQALKEVRFKAKRIVDLPRTLEIAKQKIEDLKQLHSIEQSQRKVHLKLVEPKWPVFESDINLKDLESKVSEDSLLVLEIARWFVSIFNKWDNFQEIKLSSQFLKQNSSPDYESLTIVTAN